jgi:hypothetical protein
MTARQECLTIAERLVGTDNVPAWLKFRHAGIDGKSGGWLLSNDPERLLNYLRKIDAQLSGEDDELLALLAVEHTPARRKRSETNRLLAVLDELSAVEGRTA